MEPKILFQRDRLTVKEAHLVVGDATVFYSSISAVSIYAGHPLRPAAILASLSLVPIAVLLFALSRIMGSLGQRPSFLPMLLFGVPYAATAVWAFRYQVQCLFVTISGQAVAVLKSKDRSVLEQAKALIEQAKVGH